ncbi:Alpha/beta hydrolase fold-1 [Penicillium occitanis (nom. inval.)]|nr:hypothetical protein PENOC_049260 [Penicillium occitanis (nom. inval.)]PCH02525.1 Alpha/beta hydrolase fold-1 [Penicillium occitanis (nom. inval.)]
METPTTTKNISPEDLSDLDPRIKPFKISIPDSHLSALHQKLEHASFPDELLSHDKSQEWDMGAPLEDIKRLTTYWREGLDWRKAERELNETLPQYVTAVSVEGFGDDVEVHFVYQRARRTVEKGGEGRAIPLLFLHGWPGSFIEVKKVLPLLTRGDEDQPTFDVVAPSLPNFGFSGGISKKGFGLAQYAESMHALMTRLGYAEYIIQGGDWGSFIARAMALRYPQQSKAIHLNFIPTPPPYPWRNPILFFQAILGYMIPPFSSSNRRKIATLQSYLGRENAYAKQQDTYPQTLGYALNDSPVGLLAWVYDKLHRWTDGYAWTDEEILEWVSIYVFSKAGPAASLRIYHESVTRPATAASGRDGLGYTWLSRDEVVSTRIADCVKIAVANFPGEIIQIPGTWLRAIGNIVRETEFKKGGHFAAWEAPEVLVNDLKAFMGRSGEAYGAVTNRDGF